MAKSKRSEALKAKVEEKAEAPESRSGSASPNAEADGEVQLSLRLRPGLKSAILDAARQRRVTVKQLVLSALRDVGLPVEDSDLLDRREGAPRRLRQGSKTEKAEKQRVDRSHSADESGELPVRTPTSDLAGLAAVLADILDRRTGGCNGPNIRISNGGCCCGHRSAARNSTNNRRRK